MATVTELLIDLVEMLVRFFFYLMLSLLSCASCTRDNPLSGQDLRVLAAEV